MRFVQPVIVGVCVFAVVYTCIEFYSFRALVTDCLIFDNLAACDLLEESK